MTEEGFRRYLAPHIKAGVAFFAYWYPNGYGLAKTGPMPTEKHEYVLHRKGRPDKNYGTNWTKCKNVEMNTPDAWMETISVPGKPRQIAAGEVKKWKKNIERLRRTFGDELVTVEFDGNHICIEGGFEL